MPWHGMAWQWGVPCFGVLKRMWGCSRALFVGFKFFFFIGIGGGWEGFLGGVLGHSWEIRGLRRCFEAIGRSWRLFWEFGGAKGDVRGILGGGGVLEVVLGSTEGILVSKGSERGRIWGLGGLLGLPEWDLGGAKTLGGWAQEDFWGTSAPLSQDGLQGEREPRLVRPA